MDIIIEGRQAGKSIREVLTDELGYSSNMIKKLKFSERGILVDGSFVTVRHILRDGETLSLKVEDGADDVSPYTIPVDLPLPVIYEDDWITAVNKPYAMPAHPSLGHKTDTVSNALAYRYRGKNYVFRPINRLDRDTSGCMLTANSKASSYKMYLAMTRGQIRKSYIAVTCGDASGMPRRGVLHSYMKRKDGSVIERVETSAHEPGAKEAVTEYEVLLSGSGCSVLRLFPLTGRTHQIRVQLASAGLPIVGDDLYGSPSEYIERQALHSFRTEFPHPADGKRVSVSAPLYEDMTKLIKILFPSEAETLFKTLAENREDK